MERLALELWRVQKPGAILENLPKEAQARKLPGVRACEFFEQGTNTPVPFTRHDNQDMSPGFERFSLFPP